MSENNLFTNNNNLISKDKTENQQNTKHSLLLENRNTLEMTGIIDVDSFNEEEITAVTDYGDLLIKGQKLHVEVLDLQRGELKICGTITALIYSDKVQVKGLFKKVFS